MCQSVVYFSFYGKKVCGHVESARGGKDITCKISVAIAVPAPVAMNVDVTFGLCIYIDTVSASICDPCVSRSTHINDAVVLKEIGYRIKIHGFISSSDVEPEILNKIVGVATIGSTSVRTVVHIYIFAYLI